MSEPRLVEVRKNVLKQNDVIARGLREQFRAAGVFVVSLVRARVGQDDVSGKDAYPVAAAVSSGGAGRRSGHGE